MVRRIALPLVVFSLLPLVVCGGGANNVVGCYSRAGGGGFYHVMTFGPKGTFREDIDGGRVKLRHDGTYEVHGSQVTVVFDGGKRTFRQEGNDLVRLDDDYRFTATSCS